MRRRRRTTRNMTSKIWQMIEGNKVNIPVKPMKLLRVRHQDIKVVLITEPVDTIVECPQWIENMLTTKVFGYSKMLKYLIKCNVKHPASVLAARNITKCAADDDNDCVGDYGN